jgi:type II secretion system protein N
MDRDRTKKGYSFWAKVGFVLYVIICLIIFIYMQFPYDTLKTRLEQTLSTALGKEVTLGHIHSQIPFGFAAQGLDINAVPVATNLIFHPHLTSLLSGTFGVDLSAQLISGSVKGFVKTPMKSAGNSVEIFLDADNVDSAAFTKLLPANLQPRGIIAGHAEFKGPPDSIDKAQGMVSLVWKEGSIPLAISSVPLDALAFTSLEVDAKIDKGMLTIERAELNGDISGTIKGAIRVRNQLERSRLNLTGEIMLPEGMKSLFGTQGNDASQGLKFSLRGTIDRPRFRVLSR